MRQWIRQLQAYGRTAGPVAIAAVWLLALQIWWVAPRRAELADRQAALARKRTDIARMRLEANRLPAVEAGIANLEAHLSDVQTARAGTRDTAALLRRVELLAAAGTLSLRAYAPEPALVHDLHSERPSRLELSGGYPDLLRFFDGIDGCAGEVAIGDLVIRAAAAAEAGATVSATFTVTEFALNDPVPEPAGRRLDAACRPVAGAAESAVENRQELPDPFAPLPPAADPPSVAARPPGLAGLRVGELILQGLVLSAGRQLAVVSTPNGETYILHGGERLLDGTVAAVNVDAVVFLGHAGGSAGARETRMSLEDPEDGR